MTTTIEASMFSAVLQPMANKAGTMILDHCDVMVNIKSEIDNLKNTLHLILGVVEEVEEKQIGNAHLRTWLRKLVDIGYEARDALDDFITLSAFAERDRTSESVRFDCLSFFLSCFNVDSSSSDPVALPFIPRLGLAKDILNVRKRLDEMIKERHIVTILEYVRGADYKRPISRRPKIGPFINKQKNLFVGRESTKEEIMKKVLDHDDTGVHLIPIWGMGGVGKTTLARSIYNDDKVSKDIYPPKNRVWYCVGEKKLNAKEIITNIVDGLNSTMSVEVIQGRLLEKFKGHRFLIILDDVWDVDSSGWKFLMEPLTHVGKGGVIILTTRKQEVITATDTLVPKRLEPLSQEDCWKIFENHAFVDGNSNTREDLKCIGQKIVEKLKGLPLAAEVVGRSLLNEADAETWKTFFETNEWKLRDKDDDVMPALKWSYNRLPPHLKQCFTYCSLFPKDHKFDKKLLIEMWMAHDLIPDVGRARKQSRPEDIGDLYFKELVNASLFQCVNGEYIMHDMIHDLALLVSNEEFVDVFGPFLPLQMDKVRHIHIVADDNYLKNLSLCKSERVLTLYTPFACYNRNTRHLDKDVLNGFFERFKSIRVLVLWHDKITEIPECIRELKHLRYLDISKTGIKGLPDSLCDLYNLKTLATPPDVVLPKDIVNMVNLRHLRANLTTYNGIRKLKFLQELSTISVCEEGYIRELGDLRELRGKLEIQGLKNVTCLQDAAQAKMQDKAHIDQLILVFNGNSGSVDVATDVLSALQCPPNLTHLVIDGYTGLSSPNWMTSEKLIANLKILVLYECHQLKFFPPLGEYNSLKDLSLCGVHEIERFGDEIYGKGINGKVFFPSLESLCLFDMNKWKGCDHIIIVETSVSVSFFPCLTRLDIGDCPKLVSVLPQIEICASNPKEGHLIRNAANVMRSLSYLYIHDCDGLQLLNLDGLVCFKCLKIRDCSNLIGITLPLNVEELDIQRCQSLKIIEGESLPSLRILNVVNCYDIISIPRLVKIEELELISCRKLTSLNNDIQAFDSLRFLSINRCPLLESIFKEGSSSSSSSSSTPSPPLSKLEALHTDNKRIFTKLFQHELVSIVRISIIAFNEVECFDEIMENKLHKLKLLRFLTIASCEDLMSLSAGGLPLSLESLLIHDCRLLSKRSKDKSDLDWQNKTKHIHKIRIHDNGFITVGGGHSSRVSSSYRKIKNST